MTPVQIGGGVFNQGNGFPFSGTYNLQADVGSFLSSVRLAAVDVANWGNGGGGGTPPPSTSATPPAAAPPAPTAAVSNVTAQPGKPKPRAKPKATPKAEPKPKAKPKAEAEGDSSRRW